MSLDYKDQMWLYNQAVELMAQDTIHDYEAAINRLAMLDGWANSAELIRYCRERIKQLTVIQEEERVATERAIAQRFQSEARSKRNKLIIWMLLPLMIIAGVITILLDLPGVFEINYNGTSGMSDYEKQELYEEANELMANGNYRGAIAIYERIPDYKDSESNKILCETILEEEELDAQYERAAQAKRRGDYETAIQLFMELGTYRDSAYQQTQVLSLAVQREISQGDYADAYDFMLEYGIPDGGHHLFSACNSMINGRYADAVKAGLTDIILPRSETAIGVTAFYDCTELHSIQFSNRITSIGDLAFFNCPNLTTIIYEGTVAQWNNITKGNGWDAVTGDYVVHCTDGNIYKQAQ